MEMTRVRFDPVVAARGLKQRVGRVVRRLRDQAHLAIPSENEFLGALGGRYGTFAEMLAGLQQDARRLFVADLPRDRMGAFLKERHPALASSIVREADHVLLRRFDLLGSGPCDLGARLPWHTDFKSGHTWPRNAYFEDLQARMSDDFGRGFDVKVPWELSRFQHLPCLGQAAWITGDPRYYEEMREEIRDWLGENRPGRGVNWTCTMDVAIRAVNWIWGYAFFRDEIHADRPFASLLLRSLYAHGRFIASHLENWPPNGNHYLADLVGLLFLGVLFRGAPEADVWKGLAIAEIVRESGLQTSGDGVDIEASTAYHRLTTEMLLTSWLLAERSGFRLPELRDVVGRRIDYIAHYVKPNGLAPQLGDNDDGRLQILGGYGADRRDHRHLLGVAACAFDDDALLALSGERWDEALWFFGDSCAERFERLREGARVRITSTHYAGAGVAILRHDDLYAILEAGPVGMQGIGTHAHNDTLSIEVHAGGRDILVDTGVGTYTPDRELRDHFRSTAAHNTVRVDGEEINPLPDEPFRLPGCDAPTITRFVSRDGFTLVDAEHRGYMRLADPVLHRRVVLLNKRTRRLLIEDQLIGRGDHRLEWFFHLDPACEADFDADRLIVRGRTGPVQFQIRPTRIPNGMVGRVEADRFSRAYGRVESSFRAHYQWEGRLPVTARFAIDLPGSAGDAG